MLWPVSGDAVPCQPVSISTAIPSHDTGYEAQDLLLNSLNAKTKGFDPCLHAIVNKAYFDMKKTALIILTLGVLLIPTYGQVELKALVGTNFSSLSNPPSGYDYAAKAGYQFGAGVLIGNKFYVEPGIQFVRRTKAITESSSSEEIDFAQNYVKIPVYAGYHLLGAEEKPLALRIFAGPAVSIPGKISKGEEQISKDDVNNALFAVDAGVGLDILFLFVELNYEYSFSNFWSDNSVESKQRGLLINAGIHIDF